MTAAAGSLREPIVDAHRVIRRLRELDDRSGGRRVAWTATWRDERARLMDELVADVPGLEVAQDPAGNLWATLPGASRETVVIGSHTDCVPGGGWLDGCLGVLAGAEVVRGLAASGPHPVSVALVDWADEEGSRFGHSLLGSSAAAGLLDVEAAGRLRDGDGRELADVLRESGVDLERAPEAAERLRDAVAYVELHIEQGPVLDDAGRAAAAVDGCFGARRSELRFEGQAAHAGATPLHLRRDPLLAAARFVARVRELAAATGGLATVGVMQAEPATPTAVPASVRLTLDLRHREAAGLDRLDLLSGEAARDLAAQEGCEVSRDPLFSIDPVPFDAGLVARAREALGGSEALTSGPLHDAAAVARAGVPAVMVFARTLGGISHSREEDAAEGDLVVAIEALARLVDGIVRSPGQAG